MSPPKGFGVAEVGAVAAAAGFLPRGFFLRLPNPVSEKKTGKHDRFRCYRSSSGENPPTEQRFGIPHSLPGGILNGFAAARGYGLVKMDRIAPLRSFRGCWALSLSTRLSFARMYPLLSRHLVSLVSLAVLVRLCRLVLLFLVFRVASPPAPAVFCFPPLSALFSADCLSL